MTTGFRRGDLVVFLLDDFDTEKQTLTMSKSAGRISDGVKVTQPKIANSVWTIYLPKKQWICWSRNTPNTSNNPVMFPSPVTGRLYGTDCLDRPHKTLLKKAGITENIPFYGLRHAFATIALQNGVDIKALSHTLSHFSSGFTLDTYTHVTTKIQKEAAEKMDYFMEMTL